VATPAVLIEYAPASAEPGVVECEPDPAPEPVEPVVVEFAAARYERERIDAWIRARIVDYPFGACLLCRKPIIAGQVRALPSPFETSCQFSSDLSRQMAY
jgi:hypothetical protein